MAGLIIGAVLCIVSLIDRHIGHEISADIEFSVGLLCMSIQYGINAIVEAIKKP